MRSMNRLLVASAICLGLAFAGVAFAAPPDFLDAVCIDDSDRGNVRAERAACDDLATGQGYNVGIFRPCTPSDGFLCNRLCPSPNDNVYACLGAPGTPGCSCGNLPVICPDGGPALCPVCDVNCECEQTFCPG